MPTLRITWTRPDTSSPFPGAEGTSTNVIADADTVSVMNQALENFQVSMSVSESADGLQKITEYVGTSADIQDFVATIDPHLNSNFDNAEAAFGMTMDVDVLPD